MKTYPLSHLTSFKEEKVRNLGLARFSSDNAIRDLEYATLLSHGRKPEVNISHTSTVFVFQISQLIVSLEKILNIISVIV